jgi:hypothetical protein
MSSLTLLGDTSGSVILQAPAVAGSGTVTLPTTGGTIRTTTTPGTVLQVVRYEISSSVSFSSSSFATAYTVSITPTSTTSKLYHTFWAKSDINNTSSQAAQDYQVTRNGTAVWGASWQNYFNRGNVATDIYPPCDFIQWDEPATTSTITYAFQGRIYAGAQGAWTIGNTNQNSALGPRGNWIIMEIAA